MKQKFVFQKKAETKPEEKKIEVKKTPFIFKMPVKNQEEKVDISKLKKIDVPETTSEDQKALDAMEKQLADLKEEGKNKVSNASMKEPTKPQLRKPHKRNISGDVIRFERWAPIVDTWAKSEGLKADLEVGRGADRVDVMTDEFRMCIMASYDSEFTVTLFYEYDKGFNTKRINVEYIKVEMLQTALQFVYDSKELFKSKE